jgi:hypothetical protein
MTTLCLSYKKNEKCGLKKMSKKCQNKNKNKNHQMKNLLVKCIEYIYIYIYNLFF